MDRAVVVLGEVWQAATAESKRDSLPLDVLLPHARRNLWAIQKRSGTRLFLCRCPHIQGM